MSRASHGFDMVFVCLFVTSDAVGSANMALSLL